MKKKTTGMTRLKNNNNYNLFSCDVCGNHTMIMYIFIFIYFYEVVHYHVIPGPPPLVSQRV